MSLNLDAHTYPVKIDAMVFTATEEPLVLVDSKELPNASDFHPI